MERAASLFVAVAISLGGCVCSNSTYEKEEPEFSVLSPLLVLEGEPDSTSAEGGHYYLISDGEGLGDWTVRRPFSAGQKIFRAMREYSENNRDCYGSTTTFWIARRPWYSKSEVKRWREVTIYDRFEINERVFVTTDAIVCMGNDCRYTWIENYRKGRIDFPIDANATIDEEGFFPARAPVVEQGALVAPDDIQHDPRFQHREQLKVRRWTEIFTGR